MSTTKPRLEQLRQSSGLAALPDSITTGQPGEFGHTITKPIGQATVDDIAFAIQALNSESSEVFRRLDALRQLHDRSRRAGGLGAELAIDAAMRVEEGSW